MLSSSLSSGYVEDNPVFFEQAILISPADFVLTKVSRIDEQSLFINIRTEEETPLLIEPALFYQGHGQGILLNRR
jgi:hypothetical protein